jgi:phospholipid transport system transporter-binding protein
LTELIQQQGNRLLVRGDMTVETVGTLLEAGLSVSIGDAAEVEVDLAQVTDVDSSAVSLLFHWLREAQARQVKLQYSNLPAALISLATLYGVLDMLPHNAPAAASSSH